MYSRVGKICREVEQAVSGVSLRAVLDTESIRFEIAVSRADSGAIVVLDYHVPYSQFEQMVDPVEQVRSLLMWRAGEARRAASGFTESAEA